MADAEYGFRYAVFVTDNGVRYLTNEVSLQIMDALALSGMTASDLSLALGRSRTSIQSNVSKLERWGFVTSYVDESDRRRVIYVPTSTVILRPCSPDIGENYEALEEEALHNMVKVRGGHYPCMLVIMALEAMRMGLDMRDLLTRGGMILASKHRRLVSGMSSEDVARYLENHFTKVAFSDVAVAFDKGDLNIVLSLHSRMRIAGHMMCDLAAGYAVETMDAHTGRKHRVASLTYDAEGRTVMRISPYDGNVPMDSAVRRTIPDVNDESWPFMIYYVDGRSVLLGNDAQIRILHHIRRSSVSPGELSEELGMPLVTVHSNLSKLNELGVIGADALPSSKMVRYRIKGLPVILTTEPCVTMKPERDIRLERELKSVMAGYEALFETLNSNLRSAGEDIRHITGNVGVRVAEFLVAEDKNITAAGFLKKVCETDMGLGYLPRITDFVPLTVVLNRNDDTFCTFGFIKPFYKGLLEHGLELLTGDNYNIRFPPPPDFVRVIKIA